MQTVRRLLSVFLILAFAFGTTVQVAQTMPMKGWMDDMAVTMDMSMEVADAPICPDCDDMDQGAMEMAACQSGICFAFPMLPPQASRLLLAPSVSPVPHRSTLGSGEAPHPEPSPPRSTLRI